MCELFLSGGGGAGNGGGGGGVCVRVCVCTFFHTCYTAPKVSYILCKDNKMYLTSPVPQSVSLSLSDWLVDSFADEREKEKLN